MPFPMDEEDAARFIVYTSESFYSLPWDELTLEQKTGVLLFVETSVARALPLLPRKPELCHVFEAAEEFRKISDLIRREFDIIRKV